MSPTYQCPKGCFGTEPFRCDHGGSGHVPAGSRASQVTLTQAMQILKGLKALGQARHPTTQNRWVRDIAPIESVKQRYREDAAALAREKKLRAEHVPLCGTSVMRDPATNLLINVSEWVARGLNR